MINILTILVLLCFIAFFIFLIAKPKNERFIDNTNVIERFEDTIEILFEDADTIKIPMVDTTNRTNIVLPDGNYKFKFGDNVEQNDGRYVVEPFTLVIGKLAYMNSLTIDGGNQKFKLNSPHDGIIQNGDEDNSGKPDRHIKNIDIEISGIENNGGGGICQYMFGRGAKNNTITNCHVNGTINNDYAGGICGDNCGDGGNVIIQNCSHVGDIQSYAGGICGTNCGSNKGNVIITNCYNTGDIQGNAGGICGINCGRSYGNVTILSCYNSDAITSSNSGGICGGSCGANNGNVAIVSCYNSGDIIRGADSAGGICGYGCGYDSGNVAIVSCYNSGAISSEATGAGGICGLSCGSLGGNVAIVSCYNSGNIEAIEAGGICGEACGKDGGNVAIVSCYNSGDIISGAEGAGGICGNECGREGGNVAIVSCYNSGPINDLSAGGICGLSCGYNGGNVAIVSCYISSPTITFLASLAHDAGTIASYYNLIGGGSGNINMGDTFTLPSSSDNNGCKGNFPYNVIKTLKPNELLLDEIKKLMTQATPETCSSEISMCESFKWWYKPNVTCSSVSDNYTPNKTDLLESFMNCVWDGYSKDSNPTLKNTCQTITTTAAPSTAAPTVPSTAAPTVPSTAAPTVPSTTTPTVPSTDAPTMPTEPFYLITMPRSTETYLAGKYELDTSSNNSTSLQWKLNREDNFFNYKDQIAIKFTKTPNKKLSYYTILVNGIEKYIYNGDNSVTNNINEIFNSKKWEDINNKQLMSFFIRDNDKISLELINESLINIGDLNVY